MSLSTSSIHPVLGLPLLPRGFMCIICLRTCPSGCLVTCSNHFNRISLPLALDIFAILTTPHMYSLFMLSSPHTSFSTSWPLLICTRCSSYHHPTHPSQHPDHSSYVLAVHVIITPHILLNILTTPHMYSLFMLSSPHTSFSTSWFHLHIISSPDCSPCLSTIGVATIWLTFPFQFQGHSSIE